MLKKRLVALVTLGSLFSVSNVFADDYDKLKPFKFLGIALGDSKLSVEGKIKKLKCASSSITDRHINFLLEDHSGLSVEFDKKYRASEVRYLWSSNFDTANMSKIEARIGKASKCNLSEASKACVWSAGLDDDGNPVPTKTKDFMYAEIITPISAAFIYMKRPSI